MYAQHDVDAILRIASNESSAPFGGQSFPCVEYKFFNQSLYISV